MCFRRGDVSYPRLNGVEGGLEHIKKQVYVKDVDEKIVRETATIMPKDV